MVGPLLGKDFECVQRIFALAGEWQASIHVLTRIASRGGGAAVAAAKQLLVMEGTAQAQLRGGIPWWKILFCQCRLGYFLQNDSDKLK